MLPISKWQFLNCPGVKIMLLEILKRIDVFIIDKGDFVYTKGLIFRLSNKYQILGIVIGHKTDIMKQTYNNVVLYKTDFNVFFFSQKLIIL